MKNKNVKVGLLVEIKEDFLEYAKAGDICEVLRIEGDDIHLLLNKRTNKEFYRSSPAYRKAPTTKG